VQRVKQAVTPVHTQPTTTGLRGFSLPILSSIAFIWVKLKRWGLVYAALLGLTACATTSARLATPIPSSAASAPTFVVAPPADALPSLIAAERQASIDQNLALLVQLWAEESRIVDGRGTADAADDLIWRGRAAVLDRYVVAVFPSPPPPLILPANLAIEVAGATATLRLGTDQWRFVNQSGRWWLAELRYNSNQ